MRELRVEDLGEVVWGLIIQLEWALDCLSNLNAIAKNTETLPHGASTLIESSIGDAR